MKQPKCSKNFMDKFIPFAESVVWDHGKIKEKFCVSDEWIDIIKKAVETQSFVKKEAEYNRVNSISFEFDSIQPTHFGLISCLPEERQLEVAEKVATEKWTVSKLESEVRQFNSQKMTTETLQREMQNQNPTGLWRCPKCNYVELYWKPLVWKVGYAYCHIDDVKMFDKDLLEKLLKNEKAEDDFYFYKLAGKGKVHVHRIPKGLAPRGLYEWQHH